MTKVNRLALSQRFSITIPLALMLLMFQLPGFAHGKPKRAVTVNITSVGGSTTSSDNTAAMKKALQLIGSDGTVVFPAGTFNFAGPIMLGSGQHFVGAGLSSTTLSANNYASAGGSVLTMEGTGCGVTNLTVAGARPPNGSQAMNGITVKLARSFIVENVQFNPNLYYGLSITSSTSGLIAGNVFNSGSQYSLYGINVYSLAIENNTFNQVGVYSIYVAPSSTNGLSGINILKNQFTYGPNGSGQTAAISVAAISSSYIESNTFSLPTGQGTAQRGAIILTGGGNVGIAKGVVISGNVCNCNAVSAGATIKIRGAGARLGVESVSVTHNTVNIGATNAYWGTSGIWVSGTAGSVASVVVADNTVTIDPTNVFPVGIMAGAGLANNAYNDVRTLIISGNTISGGSYGILCDGSTTTKIDSNTISNCQGDAIFVEYNTAGTLDVSSNVLSNCGLQPVGYDDTAFNQTAALMIVGSTVKGVTIYKNSYGSATQANNLSYFMFVDVASENGVKAAGDVTTTTLANYIAP